MEWTLAANLGYKWGLRSARLTAETTEMTMAAQMERQMDARLVLMSAAR